MCIRDSLISSARPRDRPRASTSRARPDDDARTGNNFPRARVPFARARRRENRVESREIACHRDCRHIRAPSVARRRDVIRRRARPSERFERFSVSVDSVWKKTGRSNVGDDARDGGDEVRASRVSSGVSRVRGDGGGTVERERGTRGRRGSARGDDCLLYTSPSPRDRSLSRMPSSA